MIIRRPGANRRQTRIASNKKFTLNSVTGLEMYLRADQGVTVNAQNQVSAWADTLGNHDWSSASPRFVKYDKSQYLKTPCISGVNNDTCILNRSGGTPVQLEPPAEKYLVIYTVEAAKSAQSGGTVIRSGNNNNWRIQFTTVADQYKAFTKDGTGTARSIVNNAISVPEAKIIRVDIPNFAAGGDLSIRQNLDTPVVLAGIAGYTTDALPVYIGAGGPFVWQGPLAAIVAYYTTGISDGEHQRIVSFLEQEFYEDPGFTPTDISNNVLLFDSELGITVATGVAAWADQSGNNNDANQSTGANQPALSVDLQKFNEHDAPTFDGTTDIMNINDSPELRIDGGYTIFWVGSHPPDTTTTSFTLFDKYNGAVGRSYIASLTQSSKVFSVIMRDETDTAWNSISGTKSLMDNSVHVCEFSYDPTTKTAFIDTDQVDPVSVVVTGVNPNGSALMQIGGRTSFYSKSSTCALIAYNKVLTQAEKNKVYNYIDRRWQPRSVGFGFTKGFQTKRKYTSSENLILNLDSNLGITLDPDVRVWDNQADLGGSWATVTVNRQPILVNNFANGLPGIAFDGSATDADYLVGVDSLDYDMSPGFTVYLVGSFSSLQTGLKEVWARWTGTGFNKWWLRVTNSNRLQLSMRDETNTITKTNTSTEIVRDDVVRIYRFGWDSVKLRMYLEVVGGSNISQSVPTVNANGLIGSNRIGGSTTSGAAMTFTNVRYYTRWLPDKYHNEIVAELKEKYGL